MSDPVTNVEIEDVLSSIRRLVSEGDKPRAAAPARAQTPAPTPEKLVLTPALRVDEPTMDEVDGTQGAGEDIAQDDFLVLSESPVAEVEADAEAEEVEPSPSDRADLEATIAELEAAVTAQPDEWEPDGSEVEYKPNWDRTLFQAVEEAVADATTQEVGTTLSAAMGRPSHDPDRDAWASKRVKEPKPDVEQAEAEVVQDLAEQPMPQEASEVATPTSADDASVAFRHLNREVVDPHNDLVGGAAPSDNEQTVTIEDDALRQMVLDIVRQELNGKLGERITRNVRKLVRREIMRVLNAQDLD